MTMYIKTYYQQGSRNMNPAGADGKPLHCRACGSYQRLLVDCPHSWETSDKVNIAEDENVVLSTGYNKGEISQLGINAHNCAVLDSTCSSTVELDLENDLANIFGKEGA